MNWKRFITLIASTALLLTLEQTLQACGPEPDPYDYYPSFFDNRTPKAPEYTAFRYTAYLNFYNDWWWGDAQKNEDDSLPDANITEWVAYTNNAATTANADSFVYRYPREQLSNLYYHLEKGSPLSVSGEVQQNSFTKWLQQSKDLEALGYLMYAKQCEPLVAAPADAWEPVKRDTAKMGRLLRNGLQLHKAAQKPFVKNRYAYQVLRLAAYAGNNQQTLDLYQSLGGEAITGEIGARCLGLKGSAFFRMGKKDEAAYLYTRLFDLNDGMKQTAFISFDWSGGFTNPDAVLKQCKNGHEKAVVHLMLGLKEYEEALPQLQLAYAADPSVKGLDVLMTREINKAEERYLQNKLLSEREIGADVWHYGSHYWEGGYSDANSKLPEQRKQYENYLEVLNGFAKKVIVENKNNHKGFWYLASAYLSCIQQDFDNCSTNLNKAKSQNLSVRERDLHDVIKLLASVRSAKTITPKLEQELLPALQWLDKRAAEDSRLNKSYRDFMGTVLATAYLKQKDSVKAVFALARAREQQQWDNEGNTGYGVDEDFQDLPGNLLEYMADQQFQMVKSYAALKDATPFDRWLLTNNPYSPDVLWELEGTKNIREHKFAKAVEVLSKCSAKALKNEILPDPFIVHIQDWQELEANDTTHWWSKLDFARKMVELEKKPEDANAVFQYATGLYSMTYYGKACHAYAYYRSSIDSKAYFDGEDRKGLLDYQGDYYGAYTAEKFFLKAFQKADNPELKAKSIFMAAKCWQKHNITDTASNYWERDIESYYQHSLHNPYFKQLKESYSKTGFYKMALSSCIYLSDYAKKK